MGLAGFVNTSNIIRGDSEERRIEREEARKKKEEKDRISEERRYAHENSQSLIQLAIVRMCTGRFSYI